MDEKTFVRFPMGTIYFNGGKIIVRKDDFTTVNKQGVRKVVKAHAKLIGTGEKRHPTMPIKDFYELLGEVEAVWDELEDPFEELVRRMIEYHKKKRVDEKHAAE